MGSDKLPGFIDYHVTRNANRGYDGARAIRDAVAAEVDNYIKGHDANFAMNMLGWDSWAVSVYKDIKGSSKHYMWASGMQFRHKGYTSCMNSDPVTAMATAQVIARVRIH